MSIPVAFEIIEDCAVFRPQGRVTQAEGIQMVTEAIRAARAQGYSKLIVETSGVARLPGPPSVAVRFGIATAWAEASGGKVRLALVLRKELIDPQGFTPTSAALAGFTYMPFATEAEAWQWIRSLP